mgnify:CR=1 FL=1
MDFDSTLKPYFCSGCQDCDQEIEICLPHEISSTFLEVELTSGTKLLTLGINFDSSFKDTQRNDSLHSQPTINNKKRQLRKLSKKLKSILKATPNKLSANEIFGSRNSSRSGQKEIRQPQLNKNSKKIHKSGWTLSIFNGHDPASWENGRIENPSNYNGTVNITVNSNYSSHDNRNVSKNEQNFSIPNQLPEDVGGSISDSSEFFSLTNFEDANEFCDKTPKKLNASILLGIISINEFILRSNNNSSDKPQIILHEIILSPETSENSETNKPTNSSNQQLTMATEIALNISENKHLEQQPEQAFHMLEEKTTQGVFENGEGNLIVPATNDQCDKIQEMEIECAQTGNLVQPAETILEVVQTQLPIREECLKDTQAESDEKIEEVMVGEQYQCKIPELRAQHEKSRNFKLVSDPAAIDPQVLQTIEWYVRLDLGIENISSEKLLKWLRETNYSIPDFYVRMLSDKEKAKARIGWRKERSRMTRHWKGGI